MGIIYNKIKSIFSRPPRSTSVVLFLITYVPSLVMFIPNVFSK